MRTVQGGMHEFNWISNWMVRAVPKLRPVFLSLGKKEVTDSERPCLNAHRDNQVKIVEAF
jgi:hypothetical protein